MLFKNLSIQRVKRWATCYSFEWIFESFVVVVVLSNVLCCVRCQNSFLHYLIESKICFKTNFLHVKYSYEWVVVLKFFLRIETFTVEHQSEHWMHYGDIIINIWYFGQTLWWFAHFLACVYSSWIFSSLLKWKRY